jgi:hypothetical protein
MDTAQLEDVAGSKRSAQGVVHALTRAWNACRSGRKGKYGMSMTAREVWALLHGLVFGGVFLVVHTGALAAIYSMRALDLTPGGIKRRLLLTKIGTTLMALFAWLTVVSGTDVVYPWYRAPPPEGADLTPYPRSYLIADPNLSGWHGFGMEWKEHVAW